MFFEAGDKEVRNALPIRPLCILDELARLFVGDFETCVEIVPQGLFGHISSILAFKALSVYSCPILGHTMRCFSIIASISSF